MIKSDTLVAHNGRIEEVIGYFCGSPIYSMSIPDVDFDSARESRRAVLAAQNQAEPSVSTAELNAGEAICPDNVIRRGTTLEVRGEDYYNAVNDPENTQRISIAEARIVDYATPGTLVTWRPNRYMASDARELFWDGNGKPADKNAVQRDAMVFNDDTDYALLHEEVTTV
jgi:hypothetical protein